MRTLNIRIPDDLEVKLRNYTKRRGDLSTIATEAFTLWLKEHEHNIQANQTTTEMPYLPPPPTKTCPTCHKSLTFIEQYSAWYCFDCKKYSQG